MNNLYNKIKNFSIITAILVKFVHLCVGKKGVSVGELRSIVDWYSALVKKLETREGESIRKVLKYNLKYVISKVENPKGKLEYPIKPEPSFVKHLNKLLSTDNKKRVGCVLIILLIFRIFYLNGFVRSLWNTCVNDLTVVTICFRTVLRLCNS